MNLAPELGIAQNDYDELNTKFTEVSNENFTLKTELDTLKSRVKTSDILDGLIEPFAHRTFVFMCAYCGFVGLVLLFDGWEVLGFDLPEAVSTLLVGSTAATVIGLVGMVLTGIFVGARKNAGN